MRLFLCLFLFAELTLTAYGENVFRPVPKPQPGDDKLETWVSCNGQTLVAKFVSADSNLITLEILGGLFVEVHCDDLDQRSKERAVSRAKDNSKGPANPEAYAAYQQRREERREKARSLRADIAAARPPARGWTAIQVPFSPVAGLPDPVAEAQERLRRHLERLAWARSCWWWWRNSYVSEPVYRNY